MTKKRHDLTMAETMLCIINETGTILFGGSSRQIYCEATREFVWPSGGGFASALRGLERKGLIRRPDKAPPNFRYYYEATKDGIKAYEAIRDAGRFAKPLTDEEAERIQNGEEP